MAVAPLFSVGQCRWSVPAAPSQFDYVDYDNGRPPFVAAKLTELYAAHHNGLLAEDYVKNKPALGKVKLSDFAKEFAAVYHQK